MLARPFLHHRISTASSEIAGPFWRIEGSWLNRMGLGEATSELF
jgi:hypothetical protein